MATKYNFFARELQNAFFTARTEYRSAFDKLTEAKEAKEAADARQKEHYVGENEVKRARAQANFLEAQRDFDTVKREVWRKFEQVTTELTAKLHKAVEADGAVNPDKIDQNGLELLKSGILTVSDFERLAAKYSDNPTMLRLTVKHAAEFAGKSDPETRARLSVMVKGIENAQTLVLRQWDNIVGVANTLTGQAHGTPNPNYVLDISSRWENMLGDIVERF